MANRCCHGKKTQIYLWANIQNFLLWLFFLYLKGAVERLVRVGSSMLLTPSPVLPNFRCHYSSLHSGSRRRVRQKISVNHQTQKRVIFTEKQHFDKGGSEAIPHIAFQDPGVSVPCFMELQLNAFCSVWTAQFSSNELVCLLYQYLPMF